MKYTKSTIILVILLLGLSSCKDKFNINGDAKESAIVYGLLDPSEEIHFIKITKAFVTSDNNLDVAAIADSSYFNSVEGTVQEYKNGIKTDRSWNLVDTLIENKKSGVFFYPQQKMYMFKTNKNAPLKAEQGYTYRLKLDINNGEFEVNGETELVRGVQIESLSSGFSKMQFANSLASNERYRSQLININYGNGYMYDARFKIYYSEFKSKTDSTIKSFEWKLREGSLSNEAQKAISIPVNGEDFYKQIQDEVVENNQIISRHLEKIDVILTAGSQVLNSYINVNKPTSSIAQNKITYTNLEATNDRKVLGIFAARTTVILTKEENKIVNGAQLSAINENSMRELCKGQYTGLLLFCSPDKQYKNKDFYCN